MVLSFQFLFFCTVLDINNGENLFLTIKSLFWKIVLTHKSNLILVYFASFQKITTVFVSAILILSLHFGDDPTESFFRHI